MGRKHKTVPREAGESGQIRELKDRIRRLESDKRKLLSEIKTLEEAFSKSREFIQKKVEKISVKDMIKFANQDKGLKQISEELICKKCGSENFKYISTPTGIEIRICIKCNTRVSNNDTSDVNCIEEVL